MDDESVQRRIHVGGNRNVSRFNVSGSGSVAVVFDSGELEIFRIDESPTGCVPGADWTDCCWVSAEQLLSVASTGLVMLWDSHSAKAKKIPILNSLSSRFSRVLADHRGRAFIVSGKEVVVVKEGIQEGGNVIFSSNVEEYVLWASVHPGGCTVALCCAGAAAIFLVATAPDHTGFHTRIAHPNQAPNILRTIPMNSEFETPIACAWSKYGDMLAYASNRAGNVFLWNVATDAIEEIRISDTIPHNIVRGLIFFEERLFVTTHSGGIVDLNVDEGTFFIVEDSKGIEVKCGSIGVISGKVVLAQAEAELVLFSI